ncbi:MAG: hypothetical protein H6733_05285 [Alphaproteobacteria bacterium]|nr:hypothetical protein [Alphaproteobacteria bacterium]
MPAPAVDPGARVVLAGLLALAAWLRMPLLTAPVSPGELHVRTGEALYPGAAALHAAVAMAGGGLGAARSLSMLASLLGVVVVFRAGQRVGRGLMGATIAGLVVAAAPAAVAAGARATPDALAMLAALVHLGVLARTGPHRAWGAGLSATVLALVHPLGAAWVAGQGVVSVLPRAAGRPLAIAALVFASALVLADADVAAVVGLGLALGGPGVAALAVVAGVGAGAMMEGLPRRVGPAALGLGAGLAAASWWGPAAPTAGALVAPLVALALARAVAVCASVGARGAVLVLASAAVLAGAWSPIARWRTSPPYAGVSTLVGRWATVPAGAPVWVGPGASVDLLVAALAERGEAAAGACGDGCVAIGGHDVRRWDPTSRRLVDAAGGVVLWADGAAPDDVAAACTAWFDEGGAQGWICGPR